MEIEKTRLIREREILDAMRSEIRTPKPSQYSRELEWYIISSTWIRAWETFVNSFTQSFPPPTLHPGPIDSTDIILVQQERKVYVTYPYNPFNVLLKPKLVIKRDYYVATAAQWDYLSSIYSVVDRSEIKRFGQSSRTVKLFPKEIRFLFIQLSETDLELSEESWLRLHQDLDVRGTAEVILKMRHDFDLLKNCDDPRHLMLSSVPHEVLNISQGQTKDRNFRLEVVLRNCQIDPTVTIGKAVKPNNILAIRVAAREGPLVLRNNPGASTLLARNEQTAGTALGSDEVA